MLESAYQKSLSRIEFLTFMAKVYFINMGWTDVPDGSTQIVGIKTPAEDVAVHMYNLAAKTTGESSELQLYEDAVISGYTEFEAMHMNRSSGYDFRGTLMRGGTIDSYGSPMFQPNAKKITGGQGTQNKQAFGTAGILTLICLKKDTQYLLTFSNVSAATTDIMELETVLTACEREA